MSLRDRGRRPPRRQTERETRPPLASPPARVIQMKQEKEEEQAVKYLPTLIAMWEEEG